jgi:hypothetical protein
MPYFEPFDRKKWYASLARSAKIRGRGCVDERVRATLHEIAETFSQLAGMEDDYCFCGRVATCHISDGGKRLGLCHWHAVAWETFAKQEHKDA